MTATDWAAVLLFALLADRLIAPSTEENDHEPRQLELDLGL